jgi:hypothetical protein
MATRLDIAALETLIISKDLKKRLEKSLVLELYLGLLQWSRKYLRKIDKHFLFYMLMKLCGHLYFQRISKSCKFNQNNIYGKKMIGDVKGS